MRSRRHWPQSHHGLGANRWDGFAGLGDGTPVPVWLGSSGPTRGAGLTPRGKKIGALPHGLHSRVVRQVGWAGAIGEGRGFGRRVGALGSSLGEVFFRGAQGHGERGGSGSGLGEGSGAGWEPIQRQHRVGEWGCLWPPAPLAPVARVLCLGDGGMGMLAGLTQDAGYDQASGAGACRSWPASADARAWVCVQALDKEVSEALQDTSLHFSPARSGSSQAHSCFRFPPFLACFHGI